MTATPSVFKAVECLTKGIEIPLPAGSPVSGQRRHVRNRVRVRWWDEDATTYRAAAMLSPDGMRGLPDLPLPAHARVARTRQAGLLRPLLAHWHAVAAIQTSRCVDYSAGSGGPLVAYRFDGEPELSRECLVWVA